MMQEITAQFQNAMQQNGVPCDESITADGNLHRFHVEGDAGHTKNGWYVLYSDQVPAGRFGCWKRNINQTWCGQDHGQLNPEEKRLFQRRMIDAKAQREQERAKGHSDAKEKARTIWDSATPANLDHLYLVKKHIRPWGIRQSNDALVIPLQGIGGTIHSLQSITGDGKKRFLKNGAITGYYYPIGDLSDTLYLCEGFATGATIHEATGCGVFVAFNANNLRPVAEQLSTHYPDKKWIVCADHDQWTATNTGLLKAKEAAQILNAVLVHPDFTGLDYATQPTDFNDLMQLVGMEEVQRQLTQSTTVVQTVSAAIPKHFMLNEKGVFHIGDGEDDKPPLWLCSPLKVTAYFRNSRNEGFGLMVEFDDWDGQPHTDLLPASLLEGEDSEYRCILADKGLRIASSPKAHKLLKQYLKSSKPANSARLVYKTGWHDSMFVLPDAVYGTSKERLLLQADTLAASYGTAGTLEDWQQHVSLLCRGNARLVFAISCALAAPLLSLTHDENGGFHFRGASSIGKTTALLVAASVWGGKRFLQRWRATTNGLEALASLYNDSVLCLDELSQVEASEAGEIAYMLANGSGKQRASRTGTAREKATWRLLFLSSGEIGLSEHKQQAGKQSKAGQEIRLVDIAADAGTGLGIFETLHNHDSAAELAGVLLDGCQYYYGTAAHAFLQEITRLPALLLLPSIDNLRSTFMAINLPPNAHGQVVRVAQRFSLVAAAGELASELGVTGWEQGEALSAAKTCFNAWLSQRGGADAHEHKKAFEQVRYFFERHGDGRFAAYDALPSVPAIRDRAGFKKEGEFYVFTEVFKKDICRGLDWRHVARLLVEAGWIKPDPDGKSTRAERLPQGKQTIRCYHFSRKVLGEEAEAA